jgi:hypothetical protein
MSLTGANGVSTGAAGGIKVHGLYREGEPVLPFGSVRPPPPKKKEMPTFFTLNAVTGILQFKEPGPFKLM